MASGNKKRSKQRQKQRQHAAERRHKHETSEPPSSHEHLPKVGTPADDDYRLRRSRADLLDFGLAEPRGAARWVAYGVVALFLLAGVVAVIAFT